MLCQNCHQRSASVHITKIVNGEKKEMHLCEKCASVEGIFNDAFNFQNFITNLMDIEGVMSDIGYNSERIQCKYCGMDYGSFKKYGKFGCEKCYDTFDSLIRQLIKKVHGKELHTGKIVKYGGEKIRMKKELNELQVKLKSSIEKEEYEKAAIYRDQIKVIKDQMKNKLNNNK